MYVYREVTPSIIWPRSRTQGKYVYPHLPFLTLPSIQPYVNPVNFGHQLEGSSLKVIVVRYSKDILFGDK